MTDKTHAAGTLGLKQVLELTGLPPRLELVRDGLDAPVDLYRQVALRLANHHVGGVGLGLRESGPEVYALEPLPGNQWRDVAYALAHGANLRQDRLVYQNEEELLRRGPDGEPRDFSDYREAVLASLDLLRTDASEREAQARAFRAAMEAALEVMKARRVV